MRVLIVGAGGVGSAIASIAARSAAFEHIVVADVDPARAPARRGDGALRARRSHARRRRRTDSTSSSWPAACARRRRSSTPATRGFNPPIFDAAFEAGCHYLDMAMHLSAPHPTDPYHQVGIDARRRAARGRRRSGPSVGCSRSSAWASSPGSPTSPRGTPATTCSPPIDEIGVRDGSDLVVDGFAFAPTFSIWTTIEECLNPPLVYERERGWFTTAPFSEPELFRFPDGIGDLRCVNVEHEEVVLMPRWLDVGRVTFKYGLGDEFLDVLRDAAQARPRQHPTGRRARRRRCRHATSSPPCCPTRR